MQMVQKGFYIEEDVYEHLTAMAKTKKIPTAELMRGLIKAGIQKEQEKNERTTDFLLGLTNYKLTNGPKNLAKDHDRYAWE